MSTTRPAPHVSVLLPLHDAAEHVVASCRSVLAQTVSDLELVVVDDGSTDGSSELVAAVDDRRVRLITTAHRGSGAARNACLDAARADVVVWQHADDVAAVDRVERLLSALGAGADVVHHDAVSIDHRGRPTGYRSGHVVRPEHFPQAVLRGGTPIIPSTVMARRAVYAADRFAEDLPWACDVDLLRRVVPSATVVHIAEPLLEMRRHAQSRSALVTEAERWRSTARLISEVGLRSLVPTAFQRDWPEDGEAVATAFTAMCLERAGLSLAAASLSADIPPCRTSAAAAVVQAALALAARDPSSALRDLAAVPPNAFSAALLGDACAASGHMSEAVAGYRAAAGFDATSYDAAAGLSTATQMLGHTPYFAGARQILG